jgi:hypothetical protein
MFPLMLGWTQQFMRCSWLGISLLIDFLYLSNAYIWAHLVHKDNYGKNVTDLGRLRSNYLFSQNGWMTILFSIPWDILAFLPVHTDENGKVPVVFQYGAEYNTRYGHYTL